MTNTGSREPRRSSLREVAKAEAGAQKILAPLEREADWSVELATAAPEGGGPVATDRPRTSSRASNVAFCDEGIVTPSKRIEILHGLAEPSSFASEELRLLSAKVLELSRVRGIGCLAVTSALPGEGKSTISTGLAGALAREPGRRILLVEADVRRPALEPTLGLPPAQGLGEWLNGRIDYVPVRLVQPGGFFLLTAGQTPLERPEFLGSPRMDGLLQAARGLFDIVILDAMPVLPVADAVLIQDLVDGFLMVVRSRQTPRDALRDALARLRTDRVVGVVLNDGQEYRSSYHTRAYERYGQYLPGPSSRR